MKQRNRRRARFTGGAAYVYSLHICVEPSGDVLSDVQRAR